MHGVPFCYHPLHMRYQWQLPPKFRVPDGTLLCTLVIALQASSPGLVYLSVNESFDGGRPSTVVEDGQLSKQFAGSHLTTKLVVLCHLDITLWEVRRG